MKPSAKEKPLRIHSSGPSLTTPVILPSITGQQNQGIDIPPEAIGVIPVTAESIQLLQQKQQEVCDRSHKQSVESDRDRKESKQCIDGLEARVSFLQSEQNRKEQANKTQSQQLQNLMVKHQDDIEASKLYLEETLSKAHSLFLQKEKLLFKKHEEALSELVELRIFKQVKDTLMGELQSTQEAQQTTETKHKQQLAELEQRFLQSRQELEHEASQQLRSSLQEYKTKTSQELDVEGRLIRTQNMKMTKQLKQLEQQHGALREDNRQLQEKLKEAVLDRDVIEARIGQLQKKQSAFTEQKDKLLVKQKQTEESRLLESQGHDAEQQQHAKQHTRDVVQQSRELDSVRGALQRKDSEVRKLRKHAKALLDARSEVESLLLEAQSAAKKEVRLKEELAYREALQKHQRELQVLARGGTLGKASVLPPLPPRDHVALEDLSAQDKLQVITVVYAQLHQLRLANEPKRAEKRSPTPHSNPEDPAPSIKYTADRRERMSPDEAAPFDPFFMTAAYVEEESSDDEVFIRNK